MNQSRLRCIDPTLLGVNVNVCDPRTTLIGSILQLRIGSIKVGNMLESIGINGDG
jgi:hypothetical protein